MLDIKRLRYLEAIYRYRNFTRASEELYVSQPAISASVNSLESELGVKLILRNTKGVVFTPEGEELIRLAMPILQACRDAETRMEEIANKNNQILRMGISPTLAPRLISVLYSDFFSRYPSAEVYVNEANMRKSVKDLQEETIDVSFNAIPEDLDNEEIAVIPMVEERCMVVVSEDHPFAAYDTVDVEMLDNQPVCMLKEGAEIRRKILEATMAKGVVPSIVSEHDQIFCMLDIAKKGGYISFINEHPESTREQFEMSGLVTVPFSEPIMFEGGFMYLKKKKLPNIIQEMILFAKETKDIWFQPNKEK